MILPLTFYVHLLVWISSGTNMTFIGLTLISLDLLNNGNLKVTEHSLQFTYYLYFHDVLQTAPVINFYSGVKWVK